MTHYEIHRKLEDIRAMVGDPEIAHGAVDALYVAVLTAIRDGTLTMITAKAAAEMALQAEAIEFPRWCA